MEPRRLEIVPGEPVAFQIAVYNSRNVIDAYAVTLLGLDGPETGGGGVSVVTEPRSLSLFPGTEGTLTVLCTLPQGFPAGPRTIGVATVSTTDATVSVVEDIEVVVAAVQDLALEVRPQSVTGGRRALLGMTLENRGNVPVGLTIRADDAEGVLDFAYENPHLVAPPASTVRTRVAVSGRRPLVGSPTPRIITLAADEDGGQSRQAVATFIQKPLIPRALLTLLAVVGALGLWAAVLFRGVDQAVDDVAATTAAAEDAAAGTGVVAGRVSGPSGPLGGVMVTLAGAAEASTTSLTEGEIGSYRFVDLLTPGSYVLTFTKDGFESQTFTLELADDQVVSGRDVVLATETGSITGTVVDDTGAALGGVAVTVDPAEAGQAAPAAERDPAAPVDAVTMDTGSVGFFAVSGLPAPGNYVLTFTKPGFLTTTQTVALTAEGGGVDVAPELARLQTASVAGVVRFDRLGTALCPAAECGLAGVEIEVTNGEVSVVTRSTGSPSLGLYQADGLPAGRFTVTFSKEGYQTQVVQVDLVADQQVSLDVALIGEVGAISGVAQGCTTAELRRSDLSPLVPPRVDTLSGDGEFAFADLRTPAVYRVVFSGPEVDGFRDVEVADVDLGPGQARSDIDAVCAQEPPADTTGAGPPATVPGPVSEPPPGQDALSGEEGQEAALLGQLLGRR